VYNMPILRKSEIRKMSINEIDKRISELRSELIRLKTLSVSGGTLENPARIREIRRTIARLLTIKKEKMIS